MSKEFDFEEQEMDYADGPLSGWRRKSDGAWFAYECQPIIRDKLWHWARIPVLTKSTDVASVLAKAAVARNGHWVSVVE